MVDFVKSLAVEVLGGIIASFFILIIGYYWNPSLMEMEITFGILLVVIALITIGFFVLYRVQIHRIKRVKLSKLGAKKFSCVECGEPFEAFPPDDEHLMGSRDPSLNAIPITYTCVNRHSNTIYWASTKGVLVA